MFAKTKQQITNKCKVKLINNQTHPVSFQCTRDFAAVALLGLV